MVTKIKALCKEAGLTICALERKVGIGNGVIATWDKKSPRLENVRKVADFFGVSIDALIQSQD